MGVKRKKAKVTREPDTADRVSTKKLVPASDTGSVHALRETHIGLMSAYTPNGGKCLCQRGKS